MVGGWLGERDGRALSGEVGAALGFTVLEALSFLTGETGADCILACTMAHSTLLQPDFFLFLLPLHPPSDFSPPN